MLNPISSPNFCGGNLVINKKDGDSVVISTDKITNIENVSSTNLEKFKGVYVYTTDGGAVNRPIRIKNIPYQSIVDAYKKAKDDNVDVQLNEIEQ